MYIAKWSETVMYIQTCIGTKIYKLSNTVMAQFNQYVGVSTLFKIFVFRCISRICERSVDNYSVSQLHWTREILTRWKSR